MKWIANCNSEVKHSCALRSGSRSFLLHAATHLRRVGLAVRKIPAIRMPYLGLVLACVAGLPFLCGCMAHIHTRVPIGHHVRRHHPRVHPSWSWYGCPGYRYFDSYCDFYWYDYWYDDFRLRRHRYSSLRGYHRRYHPRMGRDTRYHPDYKYKPSYRESPGHKKPVDYERRKKEPKTHYEKRNKEGRTFYRRK